MLNTINNAPTVDAVPVVRCKDCKYFYSECCLKTDFCIDDDWFCADGERNDETKNTEETD